MGITVPILKYMSLVGTYDCCVKNTFAIKATLNPMQVKQNHFATSVQIASFGKGLEVRNQVNSQPTLRWLCQGKYAV